MLARFTRASEAPDVDSQKFNQLKQDLFYSANERSVDLLAKGRSDEARGLERAFGFGEERCRYAADIRNACRSAAEAELAEQQTELERYGLAGAPDALAKLKAIRDVSASMVYGWDERGRVRDTFAKHVIPKKGQKQAA